MMTREDERDEIRRLEIELALCERRISAYRGVIEHLSETYARSSDEMGRVVRTAWMLFESDTAKSTA